MTCRAPAPRLRPFVQLLWASAPRPSASGREIVLPTGASHLAIRTGDAPVRLYRDAADERGVDVGVAVVSGPRSTAYVKDVSIPCGSVGAWFRPGAIHHLCRADASLLAETHVALDAVCGAPGRDLTERAYGEPDPARRMDLLEAFLLARLPGPRALHPAIARSLAPLEGEAAVASVVRASGYSHRHFASLFRREVGLPPKRYGRVARFRRAVRLLADGHGFAATAFAAGYADQPHFTREFRHFAGIAPSRYARAAPARELHVPSG